MHYLTWKLYKLFYITVKNILLKPNGIENVLINDRVFDDSCYILIHLDDETRVKLKGENDYVNANFISVSLYGKVITIIQDIRCYTF